MGATSEAKMSLVKILERAAPCRVAEFHPMKMMVLVAAVAAVAIHGEEARSDTIRQKLTAKIMESIPPLCPMPENKEANDESAVVMKPVVVDANRYRPVETVIARENQKKEDEKFSIAKGGTLYTKDFGRVRAELGGWYDPSENHWSFLRFSW